ncbi:class I SAM-dependent DNA methyltransferase [Tunturiibacter gelidoferens]|uniref:site-specific DNA-methyltransferase (adenine-specific) n=1 Tax=Tunturiibacter gelidiferens TaxID=3069689 RepID=A0AAU7YUF1_9BACT
MTLSISSFIERWQQSAAAERANFQLFLSELCDFLDVPRPDPTRPEDHLNTYVFEKPVTFYNLDDTTSQGRIDLYRRGYFVLEAKQGSNPPELQTNHETGDLLLTPPPPRPARQRRGTAVRGTHGWDEAMLNAYNQAERYAKALPAIEGWPPFLVTVDVGHSIELFADFSVTGKAYLPFPDARSYRILLSDLSNPDIRERLRCVWLDPHALNPARHAAKVTREVAAKLAVLARTLEQSYSPKQVAEFLTRCIFTSFAEDVKLLPEKSWFKLLCDLRDSDNVAVFPEMASSLWDTMNAGGFSPILMAHILKFNGGLFESTEALPLTNDQLGLLIDAADSNWRDVEPAIFGTLLERALDAEERHQLGAHYTPRAYVERLVIPTIVEPLRADWADVIAAVSELVASGHAADAIEILRDFHRRLCNTRVLDPACGSGNFLYVALEHLKRLEGEILESLATLGETQQALEHTGLTVNPHQLLGIDINPRATAVADLVLWIGYLQWHFRTRGESNPPIPVISNFHNIECRDALMTWSSRVLATDRAGSPRVQWDGKSWITDSLTGRRIKDPSATKPVYRYLNPQEATWPEAEFIIGNPPYIGKGERMRNDLGDGYVEALQQVFDGRVSIGSDLVMFWWWKAAAFIRTGRCRSMGLITTKSLSQTMNRRVVAPFLESCSFSFAIPNHPWIDATSGAQVRVALTALTKGKGDGTLTLVLEETPLEEGEFEVTFDIKRGKIHDDLRIGPNVSSATSLEANENLSSMGLILGSQGFVLDSEKADRLTHLSPESGLIFPLVNGQNVNANFRDRFVIDTVGWTQHDLRAQAPEIYQHLLETVAIDRQTNRSATLREHWWLPRRSNEQLRNSIRGLARYIVTVETSKFRIFSFLGADTRPEHKLVIFGSDDAYVLGVLSSIVHTQWASAAGGRNGVGDDLVYSKTTCFEPFPFPAATEAQQQAIRDEAERLDAHRKCQQQLHPNLTLTDMYNILEKLRANEELTPQEHALYDVGLIGILRELHDELDRAVFDAYGWPHELTTDGILARVVALNAERHAEETSGLIRWLRPEFQTPTTIPVARTLEGFVEESPAAAARRKQPWPGTLPEQVRAIKEVLRGAPAQTPQQIASAFRPASRTRISEILTTLVALGQARTTGGGYSL